jgi:hypothetical protein
MITTTLHLKLTYIKLSDITVSVEEVVNNLRNLDVTKAHGPDGIHPRLLKECSEQIGPSLFALFNHSLNCGRVPIEQSRTQSNACARARMALALGKLTTGTPKFRGSGSLSACTIDKR